MGGRVLSGRYLLREIVGTGGTSVVYRAWDNVLEIEVAVKLLRPEYESDEEFVRRFSHEAKAAAQVSHENIVNLLDVGFDGVPYIVMEFVEGQTLKELIRSLGHLKPQPAIAMTLRILAAVDHAHKNNIVHRDIKPQNILVDKSGKIKVADFGIARLTTSSTLTSTGDGMVFGSIHYISPEQARGEKADEKSDLYSVAVVLYEMLTGQVPFDSDTAVSIAIKHIGETPRSAREIRRDIPRALDEILQKALLKDPAMRYQSASEMAADLKRALKNPGGGFVRTPINDAMRKKKRRRRLRFTLVAFAILVAALVATFTSGALDRYFYAVRVPNVSGISGEDALRTLDSNKLFGSVVREYSEDIAPGVVISQSPEAETQAVEGDTIELRVSLGSQWVTMPDVVGMSETEAAAALKELELFVSRTQLTLSEYPAGQVVESDPKKGEWASKLGGAVLFVSAKSERVPDLTGYTLEAVAAELDGSMLTLGDITLGYDASFAEGVVIYQSIAGDTAIFEQTKIDIIINGATPMNYTTAEPLSIDVPLDEMEVIITLTSPSGRETEVYRAVREAAGPMTISLFSSEPGLTRVIVAMDGEIMLDEDYEFK